MKSNVDMTIDFAGLRLSNPVFTASGTCGYADELAEFMDIGRLGGFITKSITLKPRKGNPPPRVVETDSGMLNAIGWANIGIEEFVADKIPVIKSVLAQTAVFVNVAGETSSEYIAVVERLASEDTVSGFELNVSCPNVESGGIALGTDPRLIEQLTRAVKKVSRDKLLIVKLSPSVTDICTTARAAVAGGADALSMVNTFTAMVIDIRTRRPVLANRTGGLSGPAIRPVAVYMVNRVYSEVSRGTVPILGGGGIRTASDALEFLIAGASAVTVGTASFIDPTCASKIIDGIEQYCLSHSITRVAELTGSLL